jgi:hypothetical protein
MFCWHQCERGRHKTIKSVFPAKAGTQTLSRWRDVTYWPTLLWEMQRWGQWMTPSPNPLPLKGARAFPLVLALSLWERVG